MFKGGEHRMFWGACCVAVMIYGEASGMGGVLQRLPEFQNATLKIVGSLPVMKPYYDLIDQVRRAYGLVFKDGKKPTVGDDECLVDAFLAEGKRAVNECDVETLMGLIFILDRSVPFQYSARFEEGDWNEETCFANQAEIVSYTAGSLVSLFEYLRLEKDRGLVLRGCPVTVKPDTNCNCSYEWLRAVKHELITVKKKNGGNG